MGCPAFDDWIDHEGSDLAQQQTGMESTEHKVHVGDFTDALVGPPVIARWASIRRVHAVKRALRVNHRMGAADDSHFVDFNEWRRTH